MQTMADEGGNAFLYVSDKMFERLFAPLFKFLLQCLSRAIKRKIRDASFEKISSKMQDGVGLSPSEYEDYMQRHGEKDICMDMDFCIDMETGEIIGNYFKAGDEYFDADGHRIDLKEVARLDGLAKKRFAVMMENCQKNKVFFTRTPKIVTKEISVPTGRKVPVLDENGVPRKDEHGNPLMKDEMTTITLQKTVCQIHIPESKQISFANSFIGNKLEEQLDGGKISNALEDHNDSLSLEDKAKQMKEALEQNDAKALEEIEEGWDDKQAGQSNDKDGVHEVGDDEIPPHVKGELVPSEKKPLAIFDEFYENLSEVLDEEAFEDKRVPLLTCSDYADIITDGSVSRMKNENLAELLGEQAVMVQKSIEGNRPVLDAIKQELSEHVEIYIGTSAFLVGKKDSDGHFAVADMTNPSNVLDCGDRASFVNILSELYYNLLGGEQSVAECRNEISLAMDNDWVKNLSHTFSAIENNMNATCGDAFRSMDTFKKGHVVSLIASQDVQDYGNYKNLNSQLAIECMRTASDSGLNIGALVENNVPITLYPALSDVNYLLHEKMDSTAHSLCELYPAETKHILQEMQTGYFNGAPLTESHVRNIAQYIDDCANERNGCTLKDITYKNVADVLADANYLENSVIEMVSGDKAQARREEFDKTSEERTSVKAKIIEASIDSQRTACVDEIEQVQRSFGAKRLEDVYAERIKPNRSNEVILNNESCVRVADSQIHFPRKENIQGVSYYVSESGKFYCQTKLKNRDFVDMDSKEFEKKIQSLPKYEDHGSTYYLANGFYKMDADTDMKIYTNTDGIMSVVTSVSAEEIKTLSEKSRQIALAHDEFDRSQEVSHDFDNAGSWLSDTFSDKLQLLARQPQSALMGLERAVVTNGTDCSLRIDEDIELRYRKTNDKDIIKYYNKKKNSEMSRDDVINALSKNMKRGNKDGAER